MNAMSARLSLFDSNAQPTGSTIEMGQVRGLYWFLQVNNESGELIAETHIRLSDLGRMCDLEPGDRIHLGDYTVESDDFLFRMDFTTRSGDYRRVLFKRKDLRAILDQQRLNAED